MYWPRVAQIIFWLLAAFVVYTYAGYPLLLALLARIRPRAIRGAGAPLPAASIILAVHNEQAHIERRLRELIESVSRLSGQGEIIVVSDGSVDATVAIARRVGADAPMGMVRVIELKNNAGKAQALARGCAEARHGILVLADARQRWANDALSCLLGNFADASIGGVSGDLVLENADGAIAGVGLYWRYEKWLRLTESRVHSCVGATGSISAVRRELFCPPPAGLVLDDVYWPLKVVMAGRRVVHDQRAIAYDRLPDGSRHEFRRKVRTLAGNFQLMQRLPRVLLPWHNPLWAQFLSHKAFRLVVPWALLGMLACSLLAPGAFYQGLFVVQVACYVMAAGALRWSKAAKWSMASSAASILLLNTAAWCAFWVWISGGTARSWTKAKYSSAGPTPPEAASLNGIP